MAGTRSHAKFLTISPTHEPGKKEYAWEKFRDGKYVAIGWLHDTDLTGKTEQQIEELLWKAHPNEAQTASEAFKKFLALDIGDYVAVNNTNAGLFGVGRVTSGYHFKVGKHDVGSGSVTDFYSHYREVDWRQTQYVSRKDLMEKGETGWVPYGTVGVLHEELPPYIERLLGVKPPTQAAPRQILKPEFLKSLISSIEVLRADGGHQERAHESLVEDFLVALGYQKHVDIQYRKGRIDLSLFENGKPLLILEVKRDWGLTSYADRGALQQVYNYAHEVGARYVAITNGDYYLLCDRLHGLTYEDNKIAEFRLSELEDLHLEMIDRMRKGTLSKINPQELLVTLSRCFS